MKGASSFTCKVLMPAAIVLGAAAAGVAAPATVTVSGDAKPSECGAAKMADYAIEMTGSLVGCQSTFIQSSNCVEMNGFAAYTEIGREEFEGTLDGQAVSYKTNYTFDGVWPSGSCPTPAPEKEVVGGCIHYLSGDNLVGVIRFWDVMSGEGAPHYPYSGTLTRN